MLELWRVSRSGLVAGIAGGVHRERGRLTGMQKRKKWSMMVLCRLCMGKEAMQSYHACGVQKRMKRASRGLWRWAAIGPVEMGRNGPEIWVEMGFKFGLKWA